MEELKKALELRQKYLSMKLEDVVKEFEEYTNQKIPQEVIDEFEMSGLNNIDFLTNGWKYSHTYTSLLNFEKKAFPIRSNKKINELLNR